MQPNQNDAMRLGDRNNSKDQPVLFIDYPNKDAPHGAEKLKPCGQIFRAAIESDCNKPFHFSLQ
jgi:hypothetical protein